MIPVSLSNGVEPGARTGTLAAGRAIVVWRGESGRVYAWEDRCPHRGMRLSFGFVRGERLTCIYHGWQFGGASDEQSARAEVERSAEGDRPEGRCTAIPAHPGLTPPASIIARRFPVAESLGMIWAGMSRDAIPLPPDLAVYPVRSITVRASADDLRRGLEDRPPPGTALRRAEGPLITFDGPGARVVAGIQDRTDESASAHVVTTGASPVLRRELCAWAVGVRAHLEAVSVP
jgi:nitrite reductase/ring-hydroxylating ferredoxin subunit